MSDVVTLSCASYMVEVECEYISLATVNARVRFQVFVNPFLDLNPAL
jgi:hypothetical protein